MLDARCHLPSRCFLFAAVFLTAASVGAQGLPDTTKRIMSAGAKQAAAQLGPTQQAAVRPSAAARAAQQQIVGVAPPAGLRWSAPKPCAGNPVYSHGKPGAGLAVPDVIGATLSAARAALGQGLTLDARLAPGTGRPDSIISQAPRADTPVAPGDTVIVCSFRQVPDVKDTSATQAQHTMGDSGVSSVVTTIPVAPTRTSPPARRVMIMPPVVGRTVRSARDALPISISFSATATDRKDSAGDAWIIARQFPAAGDTITDTTTVHLYAADPIAPVPWIWIAAGVVAVVAAAATWYHRVGKERVARMAVLPHVDPIPPRVTFQTRSGETAAEAFKRIGVSFTPVPHRGIATVTCVRLPSPSNRDHDG